MSQPQNYDEYLKRSKANQRLTGHFFETAMVLPCPFCAAPDFLEARIVDEAFLLGREREAPMARALMAGRTCRECGRSAKAIVTHEGAGVRIEVVQSGGDPLPAWLPAIRRVDA